MRIKIIFKLFSNPKFGKIMALIKLNAKIFFNKRYSQLGYNFKFDSNSF